MASVSAQGHSSAQSDFTATELSVSRWELMLGVRCQVELSWPQKEDSIVCESPGHCHTTSLAERKDGTRRLPKWCDILLVEVTARENVVHFYSKATSLKDELYKCICFWGNCSSNRDPSKKKQTKMLIKAMLCREPFLNLHLFRAYKESARKKREQEGNAKFTLKQEWIW